jgi:hypothetical protein
VPTISLTLPTAGTVITAGLHSANYSSLQTLLNGGLDTSNWASGKIFDPAKIMQSGASTGQVMEWDGANWTPTTISSTSPNYATTLPGSPTDGQEAFLVDSTTLATYQWRFRWNAGSSNTDKWEFIGGSPVTVEVATSEATGSATYTALTTAGPSFALPRAGVYQIDEGFTASFSANSTVATMSFDIGGTGAVDADSVSVTTGSGAGTNQVFTASRSMRKSGLTAVTLTSKYKAAVGTATFSKRWLRVIPVRVS